jgi:hypothetical protein
LCRLLWVVVVKGFFLDINVGPLRSFGFVVELELDIVAVRLKVVYLIVIMRSIVEELWGAFLTI